MTVGSALLDGVDLVVGEPDGPVDGVVMDVDAKQGHVPLLVLQQL